MWAFMDFLAELVREAGVHPYVSATHAGNGCGPCICVDTRFLPHSIDLEIWSGSLTVRSRVSRETARWA